MSKESLHLKKTERYARFLDSANQIFWEWNLKTNELRISDRIEAMLEYKHGELPGHEGDEILMPLEAWTAYVHQDDLARIWESLKRHLEGQAPMYEAEVRCKTKSGGWKWLLSMGRIVERDEHGAPLIMSGTHTDISHIKEAEEKIVRLSGQLRLALDAAHMGWWYYDPGADTIHFDDRYLEVLGLSEPQQTRDGILMRIHPADRPAIWEKVLAVMNPVNSKPYEAEYRYLMPDGSQRWLKAHALATFEGEGQARHAVSLVGTVSDITEQHHAEEEKARQSAQRQLVLDAAQLGSWLYDMMTGTLTYDERFEQILGLSGELIGIKDALARVHPDDRADVMQIMRTSLNDRDSRPHETEFRIVRSDGSSRWVQAHSLALFESTGETRRPTSVVGTMADVTSKHESHEQLRTLFENAGDGIIVGDMTGKLIDANARGARMLGYTRDEILKLRVTDILVENDRSRVPENWADWTVGISSISEWTFLRKDGSTFEGEVNSQLLPDGRVMGILRDVSERKKSEEELKLAAMVFQESNEAMMVADPCHRILTVNPAFESITGYRAEEAIGKNANMLFSGMHDLEFYQSIDNELNTKGYWKGELWSQRKNGQVFAIHITINTNFNPDGSVNKRVILFSDITKRKETDELLWKQANFDSLTGLPNRRFFRDRLEHEVRNARRSKQSVALFFIDLDGFKDVNDTLGHDMGDLLLQEAATRLERCVRDSDTVARLGGDEFTVILPELHDPGNVDRVAQHILRALVDPISLNDEFAYVSGSIGITLFPNDATDVEELIRNADQAMYAAKHSGKNQYHYFMPAMQEAAQKRMRLVNDLRSALENDQFDVVYQPIVEISTGMIRKAEALIRWQHPIRGVINPADFISAAEDTGMISAFGDWIFHKAAKQAAIWREQHHPDFQISVNISPAQFRREGIDPAAWSRHLEEICLPGKGIVVEITEGLLLDASSKVTDQLMMLRDAGIEVALDDFGTGYSSLAYLKKFNIDYIKIDRIFVTNLAEGSDDMALCKAIVFLAHQLGLQVIAEGVETKEQHALLASSGCDFAQGYLFSRPLSSRDFEQLLHTQPFLRQWTEPFSIRPGDNPLPYT